MDSCKRRSPFDIPRKSSRGAIISTWAVIAPEGAQRILDL
jgi:hypothetical protein